MRKNKIKAGLEEALTYVRGDRAAARASTVSVPKSIDVKAIRRKLALTQAEFGLRFGFPLATLRNWEQRHRTPEGPARVLLTLIDRIPDQVNKALRQAA
jgi:putative transcriptional regulator